MGKHRGRALLTAEHYTHRYLWHSAETLQAKGSAHDGDGIQIMAATLFVYFALEAYLNYIGAIVCPEEWAAERTFFSGEGGPRYRGTFGKLDLIAERLEVTLDRGRRPYQTLIALDERRDGVVHARPERVQREVQFKDPRYIERFDPAIYALSDETFLAKALQDVEEVADQLQRAALEAKGERIVWSPHAFRGMISHEGNSILEMPGNTEEAV